MMGEVLEKIFIGILNMSLTASIVILVVLLMRVFLKKVPKIFSYLLWMVVLFRLLCPFSFEADFSLLRVLPVSVQEQVDMEYSPMQGDFFENVGQISDTDAFAGTQGIELSMEPVAETKAEPSVKMGSVAATVCSYIWIGGVCTLLLYSLVTLVKLRKSLKNAMHLQENVYVTKAVDTPFVVGILKPRIYLPALLWEEEKTYILMHERIHIRRGDHIVKIVSFLALCLHWFNPLVWLAFFLLGKDMEMSCDEAVIRKTGGDVKKEYSASLLSLATGKRIVSGVPLAFGEGDTGSRIKNVLKYKRPATIVAISALVVCVVAAVVLLANPGKGDEGDSVNVTDDTSGNVADDAEKHNEVLYGVVTDVDFDGSTRRLLVIPNLGEIEIPGEAEIVVDGRESKELEAGDLVEITFAAGENVSVLETWPGRFSADAETITVLWQGCALTYEGDDIYQFSFPAGYVAEGDIGDVTDTKLCVYRVKPDDKVDIAMEIANWMWEEDARGNRTVSVNLSREFLVGMLQLVGSDIRLTVEKEEVPVLGQNAEGTYQVSLRSIDTASRSIDNYVSNYQSTYEGGEPLYFADDCVFKTNSTFGKYDFVPVTFEEFAEIIGEEDSFFNQPCLCTFENNEIVEVCLLSTWNTHGISVADTPPVSTFYDYVIEEEGEAVFAECYTLVRTENADISDAPDEESIEIYSGNLGDGESGFVLFKDAQGKLLYVQDAHSSRAGWNNIYVGANADGAFILNIQVEDRGDFGGYGYWAYRLDENGGVEMIAGSFFTFEFGPNGHLVYDDDLFREWIAPMEEYLADSHLLLSTQDGEKVRTEAVCEADKYNYETLNLSGR